MLQLPHGIIQPICFRSLCWSQIRLVRRLSSLQGVLLLYIMMVISSLEFHGKHSDITLQTLSLSVIFANLLKTDVNFEENPLRPSTMNKTSGSYSFTTYCNISNLSGVHSRLYAVRMTCNGKRISLTFLA